MLKELCNFGQNGIIKAVEQKSYTAKKFLVLKVQVYQKQTQNAHSVIHEEYVTREGLNT